MNVPTQHSFQYESSVSSSPSTSKDFDPMSFKVPFTVEERRECRKRSKAYSHFFSIPVIRDRNEKFFKKSAYNNLGILTNPGTGILACKFCRVAVFTKLSDLVKHNKECSIFVNRVKSLQKSTITLTNYGQSVPCDLELKKKCVDLMYKVVTCPICHIKVPSFLDLGNHLSRRHSTPLYFFKCNGCGKGFKCPAALKEHILNALDMREIGCSMNARPQLLSYQKAKILTENTTREEDVPFLRVSTDVDEVPVVKQESNDKMQPKTYGLQDARHPALAHLYCNVPCTVCKLQFDSIFDMYQHALQSHKKTLHPVFMCTGCYRAYDTPVSLRSHLTFAFTKRDEECINTGIVMSAANYTQWRAGGIVKSELL